MIDVALCMKYGCADTLLRKHREHVKEETKKIKENGGSKHLCIDTCYQKEQEYHQKMHDHFDTLKK